MKGEIDILRERIGQLRQETEGLAAQRAAVEKQTAFIKEELETLQSLFDKGQTTKPRILSLQRSAAGLEGEWGRLTARIAGAEKAIGETRLEILQKQKTFRSEVVTTLREIQGRLVDLRERRVASADILERLEISAPAAGKIVGLAVHAKGAIIRPGETIMEIVPIDDRLIFEVRVQPHDVDSVKIGQPAEIQLTAFNRRTTPQLKGTVHYVSADVLEDARSGGSRHYDVRIEVPDAELERLDGRTLQPGMPAEVLIRTGERTPIEYLLQPIVESLNRAWREQ